MRSGNQTCLPRIIIKSIAYHNRVGDFDDQARIKPLPPLTDNLLVISNNNINPGYGFTQQNF
jgi:hypothetical protein